VAETVRRCGGDDDGDTGAHKDDVHGSEIRVYGLTVRAPKADTSKPHGVAVKVGSP
jgi:hypothetical protein